MAGSAPPSQSIKKEDNRPTAIPTTRKRDPRSFRKRAHQHHPDEADPHVRPTRVAREGGGGWAGLSRSVSDGAAWQAHAKSPSAQVRLELVFHAFVCQAIALHSTLMLSFANVTCVYTPSDPVASSVKG